MFERYRIGGVVYNFCDELNRSGIRADKRQAHNLIADFIDLASNDMRRLGLRADQAAAALIVGLGNGLSASNIASKLFETQYEHYSLLFQLYCLVEMKVRDRPDYYSRAATLLNDDTFGALEEQFRKSLGEFQSEAKLSAIDNEAN